MADGWRELTVTHDSGPRFRISVRNHEFVVDQPRGVGGEDKAPTPTELFVASIASCAAFYGNAYLARRGLPDTVDVIARWRLAPKPDRVERVVLQVDAPGVPADKVEVFRRVIRGCLVHNSIEQGVDVSVELQAPLGANSSAG